MEYQVMQEVLSSISRKEKVALVTLIEVNGSTPADSGNIMAVWEDGRIVGTIGGGKLEYQVIQESKEALKKETNFYFVHTLKSDGDLEMECGGKVTGFIKVFIPQNKLLMIGGGHIGEKVLQIAKFLNFYVTVLDDRQEFLEKDSLRSADEIIISPYNNFFNKIYIDENTYIVIATKGHKGDQEALEEVLRSSARYIGIIGSKNKINFLKSEMLKKNYLEEEFEKVYAPIGLGISDQSPQEIAVSILSEILLIKNQKELKHMDKTKN